MGDPRVRQQAFDVLLGNGHDVAVGHGEDRGANEQQDPHRFIRGQGDVEHSNENGYGCGFWCDGEKRGDRCGGPLVGIRNPGVKRNGADLESEGREDQQEADGQAVASLGRGHL